MTYVRFFILCIMCITLRITLWITYVWPPVIIRIILHVTQCGYMQLCCIYKWLRSLWRLHIWSSMPYATTTRYSLHIAPRTTAVHVYSNRDSTPIEPPFNVPFSAISGKGNPYRSDFTAWHFGKNRNPAWRIVVYGHFHFPLLSVVDWLPWLYSANFIWCCQQLF